MLVITVESFSVYVSKTLKCTMLHPITRPALSHTWGRWLLLPEPWLHGEWCCSIGWGRFWHLCPGTKQIQRERLPPRVCKMFMELAESKSTKSSCTIPTQEFVGANQTPTPRWWFMVYRL